MTTFMRIATITVVTSAVVFVVAIPFTIRAVMQFLEGVDDDDE